jgi:hypothetical protein
MARQGGGDALGARDAVRQNRQDRLRDPALCPDPAGDRSLGDRDGTRQRLRDPALHPEVAVPSAD